MDRIHSHLTILFHTLGSSLHELQEHRRQQEMQTLPRDTQLHLNYAIQILLIPEINLHLLPTLVPPTHHAHLLLQAHLVILRVVFVGQLRNKPVGLLVVEEDADPLGL